MRTAPQRERSRDTHSSPPPRFCEPAQSEMHFEDFERHECTVNSSELAGHAARFSDLSISCFTPTARTPKCVHMCPHCLGNNACESCRPSGVSPRFAQVFLHIQGGKSRLLTPNWADKLSLKGDSEQHPNLQLSSGRSNYITK